MTTNIEKLIGQRGKHAVGYFSSIVEPRQVDGGAKCSVDIDNTELVELYFDADDQEVPYIKPMAAGTTEKPNLAKGYIVMSSEVLHMAEYETKLSFYNGKGTMANVFVQEPGVTFNTTNFKIGTTDAAKTPAKGWYAKWVTGVDTTHVCPTANGHFELSVANPGGPNVFMVWGTTEDETEELLGLDTIELYCMQ